MSELIYHKMWLKQFLKAFAERTPEFVWLLIAQGIVKYASPEFVDRISKVENLNDATNLGHDLAAEIFGGENERQ